MTETVTVPPVQAQQSQAEQQALLDRVDRAHSPTNPQPPNQAAPATPTAKYLGKYETTEQLEEAYRSLQAEYTRVKQGAPAKVDEAKPGVTPTPVDPAAKPDDLTVEKPAASQLDYAAFTKSVTETGTLTDADIQKIEAAGIPKDVALAYVEGLKALAQRETTTAVAVVGGQESWDAIKQWASVNLDDAALDAFNTSVRSGGAVRDQALLGLKARFDASTEGTLLAGNTSNPGVAPFASMREVSQAMQDKRYGKDAAYTSSVEARVKVSKI